MPIEEFRDKSAAAAIADGLSAAELPAASEPLGGCIGLAA
jgi:hypothetical protein